MLSQLDIGDLKLYFQFLLFYINTLMFLNCLAQI